MNNQPDPNVVPRYCGFSTFARLRTINDVKSCDTMIVGIPFDNGCTFRTGARFGPEAIRSSSRLIRNFNINQNKSPFNNKTIIDGGDLNITPFNIHEAIKQMYEQLLEKYKISKNIIIMGGDHTISYPSLKATNKKFGKVALIHFDSHFDTWDEYFGEKCTHGTPFKRALDENLIDVDHSMHVGIHGTIKDYTDIENDEKLGFKTIFTDEIDSLGLPGVIDKILKRIGDVPCYISIDIDCVDPAYAPGTGTPEPGGFSSRELFNILKGITKLKVVGGDIVEVSPSYDSNSITSQLAAHLAYELITMIY